MYFAALISQRTYEEGKITDETRIRAALPTIQYLVEQGAKVILASHLGRPKGQVVEEMRLTPVAARLGELLGKDVKKADEAFGPVAQEMVAAMNEGDVLVLENVRFYAGGRKERCRTCERIAQHLLTSS